jgi:glycosyltransferase involved in cell wall biosynthesis
MGVVVVIPAFNEERFIGSVVLNARKSADAVIVVDDGSSDRTAWIAESAGATVLRQHNRGYGGALSTGFQAAMSLRPKAIVMLDGDAQHDPDEIPAVTAPILDGVADVVIGSRFLGKDSEIPSWRKAGQHALTAVTNKAGAGNVSDSQSGFRAFTVEALHTLRFGSNGMGAASEMLLLLPETSLRVVEVPIGVSYHESSKRNPLAHGLEVMDTILSLVARRRPLALLGIPGATSVVLGVLLGLWVFNRVETSHLVPFGSAVLSSLLILVGLLLGVTGIILNSLEYLLSRIEDKVYTALSRTKPESRASERAEPNHWTLD